MRVFPAFLMMTMAAAGSHVPQGAWAPALDAAAQSNNPLVRPPQSILSIPAPTTSADDDTPRWRGQLVDIGRVQKITAGAIATVSFRTAEEGWVATIDGQVFHTLDGGSTFKQVPSFGQHALFTERRAGPGYLSRIEWLSDRSAVALGCRIDHMLTTSDGGATWNRHPFPWPNECIHTATHFGLTTWACGSSGRIYKSHNGVDFAPTHSTPLKDGEACGALSLLNERVGWAGSSRSTRIYQTHDGGESWTEIGSPDNLLSVASADLPGSEIGVRRLQLLTPTRAWVRIGSIEGQRSVFYTSDGGHTWSARGSQAPPPALVGERWGSGLVLEHSGLLTFLFDGKVVRTTPIVEQHTSYQQALLGVEILGSDRVVGWTQSAIIESYDGGKTWSAVPVRVPGQIRRLVHTPWTVLLEQMNGKILSTPFGALRFVERELEPSRQPEYDRYRMDLANARRLGRPLPTNPILCLADTKTGSLRIESGLNGPGGVLSRAISFSWTGSSSYVKTKHCPPQKVQTTQLQDTLRSVADAIQRYDEPISGSRTCPAVATVYFTRLAWRCGNGPRIQASFEEDDCAPAVGPSRRIRALFAELPAAAPIFRNFYSDPSCGQSER